MTRRLLVGDDQVPRTLQRRGDEFVAIEVKAGTSRPGSADLRGLRAVADLAGLRNRLLIYRGQTRLATEDGIHILPVHEFLAMLESGTLF